MVILDVWIVNVALPSMRDSLGLTATGLQWVVNAYTLTFAGLLLFGGRAATCWRRQTSSSPAWLSSPWPASPAGWPRTGGSCRARAVQGVGGAILTPSTLSLLTTTYTEPRARARALGVWAGGRGRRGIRCVVGGVLTGLLGWRWVLFVNVPIGVLLFVGAVLALPREPRLPLRGRLDLPGALTVTLGSACLIGGLVRSEEHGWVLSTLVLFAVALVLLCAFVLIERRAAHPLVPLSVFRIRSLALANGLSLLTSGLVPAVFFFVSLYLQQGLGWTRCRPGSRCCRPVWAWWSVRRPGRGCAHAPLSTWAITQRVTDQIFSVDAI